MSPLQKNKKSYLTYIYYKMKEQLATKRTPLNSTPLGCPNNSVVCVLIQVHQSARVRAVNPGVTAVIQIGVVVVVVYPM